MSSLGRSTRLMALGTVASRGTGFVRTAVIAGMAIAAVDYVDETSSLS